jgi:hypothetical protein
MRFTGLRHRMARGRARPARPRAPATSAAGMKSARLIIPAALLAGLVAACGAPGTARAGSPRTGCAQARAPIAMITAVPGAAGGHAKQAAHVLGSARFTRALVAAESAAAEELRGAEHRLGADGRVFAAHTTARTGHAVVADVRAIQAHCA